MCRVRRNSSKFVDSLLDKLDLLPLVCPKNERNLKFNAGTKTTNYAVYTHMTTLLSSIELSSTGSRSISLNSANSTLLCSNFVIEFWSRDTSRGIQKEFGAKCRIISEQRTCGKEQEKELQAHRRLRTPGHCPIILGNLFVLFAFSKQRETERNLWKKKKSSSQ